VEEMKELEEEMDPKWKILLAVRVSLLRPNSIVSS
jgi:hypothetical protein